ncbi:carboxypeptidase [Sphaerisporangium krabiense]|uniref:Membrane peptidoglycan carboxypeptidase n=1 Tax=Sphaerisporangium krabiense TaxID=763782 RepID=A0A7W8Z4Q2_9ACTN|nr:transglycosylase domain-containing protein [Sphaerisporangium krabiense]MBB5627417.1 membrane peptidoglycan carboxypeptidase [Sphaerisporangium krabiense]GII64446.1 carboxypeptidase [Sphaerisporangium krabiense]
MGVAGGVLVAGVALPAVGGAGFGLVSAVDEVNLTPEELSEPPPAEVTVVQDAKGHEMARFYEQYREVVNLDDIAPVMRTAIISIEDYRFYEHGAIDIEGTARALATNLKSGGVSQGGSSITQQYVKQVLLNAATTDKEKNQALEASYARKLKELRYAMGVEQKYTKDEILTKYLNIAYFGAGAYGVEAAAKRFFGVSAKELTLAQAATLAGAVQDPNATDPNLGKKQRQRLLDRRNVVLARMAELGKITQAEAAEAKATKLGYKGTKLPGGCESSKYPYFCIYVRNEILSNPDFGATTKDRVTLLNRGGLTIKTTIDPAMQAAAEKAIKNWVRPSDNPVAAEALVRPGTGEIKAMAASREYGRSKARNEISYNVVADAAHGGGVGFQAGSTFKTFTLLTALKQGYKIDDGISAGAGFRASGYSAFKNCKGQNVGDPAHTVTNDEGSPGWKTLQTGTWQSVNTFFMELEQRVGLCDVVKTAESLGIHRSDGNKLQEYETFTLGINEMDPVTVANAYATIAARGRYCAPTAITQITDRNGETTAYDPKCRQVMEPEVADAAAEVLSGVFTKGTMRAVGGIGRDAAGKTGTTDDYASAWFAGFTPDLAAAVSIGDPRGSQRHKLIGVTIGGRYYGSVFGASIPGPIWKQTMLAALKNVEPTSFTPIDSSRFGGCGQSCRPEPPADEERGEEHPRGRDDGRGEQNGPDPRNTRNDGKPDKRDKPGKRDKPDRKNGPGRGVQENPRGEDG